MKRTLRRRAYVLEADVKCGDASDKHLRKLKVIEAGTPIIRESGSGDDNHDVLYVHDEDAMPIGAVWPHQPLFSRIEPHLKRAKPSAAKLLYEYNVYDPHAVALILEAIVSQGHISVKVFENVIRRFREEYQEDVDNDKRTEIEEDNQ
jgi:hypothetical protein